MTQSFFKIHGRKIQQQPFSEPAGACGSSSIYAPPAEVPAGGQDAFVRRYFPPEDTEPLKQNIEKLALREIDVALFFV